MFFPGFALALVGLEYANDPWIRVVGVLAFEIGCYFIYAGQNEVVSFYRVSILGRLGVAVAFVALVLSGLAPVQLLLFAFVDASSALWTGWTLRGSAESA